MKGSAALYDTVEGFTVEICVSFQECDKGSLIITGKSAEKQELMTVEGRGINPAQMRTLAESASNIISPRVTPMFDSAMLQIHEECNKPAG